MRQDKLAVTVTPLQVPLGQEEMLDTQRGQVAHPPPTFGCSANDNMKPQ